MSGTPQKTMTESMETICRKCIGRGAKKWIPTQTKEYQKLFIKLPWFSNVDEEIKNSILVNIASQLQLMEFLDKISRDCDLSEENNFYNEKTGEHLDADSELESILIKQEICAIGAIVEAICYTILRYNQIDFPETLIKKDNLLADNTSFAVILDLIGGKKGKKLLPKDEIKLCYKIKNFRNKIHLFDQINTDIEIFSRNERDEAMSCLCSLLKRWLNASVETMQIYFPFLSSYIKRNPDNKSPLISLKDFLVEEKKEQLVKYIEKSKIEWGEESTESMNWKTAEKWCKDKGEGWRLPTFKELKEALHYKTLCLKNKSCYWTNYIQGNSAWWVSLNRSGDINIGSGNKDNKNKAIVVRSSKSSSG